MLKATKGPAFKFIDDVDFKVVERTVQSQLNRHENTATTSNLPLYTIRHPYFKVKTNAEGFTKPKPTSVYVCDAYFLNQVCSPALLAPAGRHQQ